MTDIEQPEQPDRSDRVEHRMERTYELNATPEQVWDAIATADGISAWMVPTRLDPQVGGAVSFDLGDVTSVGVVTEHAPNRRFAIRGAVAHRRAGRGLTGWNDRLVRLDRPLAR
jgi:uncharacterized protein YndB with AHSA1/START domain